MFHSRKLTYLCHDPVHFPEYLINSSLFIVPSGFRPPPPGLSFTVITDTQYYCYYYPNRSCHYIPEVNFTTPNGILTPHVYRASLTSIYPRISTLRRFFWQTSSEVLLLSLFWLPILVDLLTPLGYYNPLPSY